MRRPAGRLGADVSEPPTEDGRIGLVLSGGGARCFAQIGALKAVDEEGLRVAAITGNSSAAILGALYAACCDAGELEAIVRGIDYATFLDADGSTGLIGHDGVRALLEEHAPATFEELRIPLAVPVVDIERAELLIFKEGPLGPPVCASNAFPGLFTPVEYQGRFLMDGGIVNNFPVDVIRTMTSRPVLAVDVRPSPTAPLDLEKRTPDSLLGKLGALFKHGAPTTIDILMQAYTITQSRLVEITCAMHPPNVWLKPDLPYDLDIQDFSRLDDALEIGYRSVKEAVAAGRFDRLVRDGRA
jgi:NTE family protein